MRPVIYSENKKPPKRGWILKSLIVLFVLGLLAFAAALYFAYQHEASEVARIEREKAEKLSHYPEAIHKTMARCTGCHEAYKDKETGPSFYLAAKRYDALGNGGTFEQFKKSVFDVKSSTGRQRSNYFVTVANAGGMIIREESKKMCSADVRIPEAEYRKVYDWLRGNKWEDSKYVADPKRGFIANGRYSKTTAANTEINPRW